MEWIQTEDYTISTTEEGTPIIGIEAFKEKPKDPVAIYDGKEHVLFLHNDNLGIVLDHINPETRMLFHNAQKMQILEIDSENAIIVRDYQVKIEHIAEIEIPQEI